ncbi:TIGR02147 family protein [Bdellovibrio sp. HCB2-146]|uniref:TIGR02147 family protein n=1 Tax=Bdellovibrio sp. HCB2-146 TaxID=3394362 RepID=UPI0039BD0799
MTNSTQLFFEDYRQYLREAFDLRSSRNKNYSLRSFAKDLGLAVSTLTEVLAGKYGLSPERATDVAVRLNLSAMQSEHFCNLVTMRFSRKMEAREEARRAVEQRLSTHTQEVPTEQFKTIAQWQHSALLRLLETKNYVQENSWIGQRLGLPPEEVDAFFERLEKLNLIVREDGRFKPTGEFVTVGDGRASEALRQAHKDIMKKAIVAIDDVPINERQMSSTMFAIDKNDLEAAKEELTQFRRQFASKYCKGNNTDDVYVLGMQFFSLLN